MNKSLFSPGPSVTLSARCESEGFGITVNGKEKKRTVQMSCADFMCTEHCNAQ